MLLHIPACLFILLVKKITRRLDSLHQLVYGLCPKMEPVVNLIIILRPLENAQFCSSSRQAKILTTGIHLVF